MTGVWLRNAFWGSGPLTPVRVRLLIAVAVAAVAGIQLLHFLTTSPAELTEHGYFLDDAFFYSVPASNFRDHGFFTLDGVMSTNGFQPLWMGVQVALQYVFPDTDAVRLLGASSWFSYVLFAFLSTFFVAKGAALEAAVRIAILCGVVTLNVRFQHMVVQGLETPLMLALVMATLLAVRNWTMAEEKRSTTFRKTLILAVLATACFFARFDLFCVAAVIAVWLAFVRRLGVREVAWYCAIVAVPVAGYLAWNIVSQGSPVSIAGRVKMYELDAYLQQSGFSYWKTDAWRGLFAAFQSLPGGVRLSFGMRTVLLVAGQCAAFAAGLFVVWRYRARRESALLLLSVVVIAHLAIMYGLYRTLRPETAYYFALEILWFGLVFSDIGGDAWRNAGEARRVVRSAVAGLTLVVLAVSAHGYRALPAQPFWVARVEMAQELAAHRDHGGCVGAYWPGVFAQFSGTDVTSLDGVIGSDAFFEEHVKAGTEIDYLLEHGCRDVVIWLPHGLDEVFADVPPKIVAWSGYGPWRMWHYRDRLHVLFSRPYGKAGEGWYLLRIE
jgi:hypothetical protein